MQEKLQQKLFKVDFGNNQEHRTLKQSIGIIKYKSKQGLTEVNGYLIGPDLVLTTNSFIKQDTLSVDLFFCISNKQKQGKEYKIKQYRYNKQTATYALLKLEQKIIREGYIQLGYYEQFVKQNILLIGIQQEANNYCFKQYSIFPLIKDQKSIEYTLNPIIKMDGAALLIARNNKYMAIGINQLPTGTETYHSATLLDYYTTVDILVWQKQMTNDIKVNIIKKLGYQENVKLEAPKVGLYDKKLEAPQGSLQDKQGKVVSFWDKTAPYANRFTINGHQVIRAQHFDQYSYQITSKDPLVKNKTTTFKFTIDKFAGKFPIVFALITEGQRKERWSGGKMQSIGLWVSPQYKEGSVYVDGVEVTKYTKDLFTAEGGNFLMQVNLHLNKLTFTLNENKRFSYDLVNRLKTDKLYISISMYEYNDAIKIQQLT